MASERNNRYMCTLCWQPLYLRPLPSSPLPFPFDDLQLKFACKSFLSLEQQLCAARRLGEFRLPSLTGDCCFLLDCFCVLLDSICMCVCKCVCWRKWLRKWARKIVHTTGNLEKFRCILRQLQTDPRNFLWSWVLHPPFPCSKSRSSQDCPRVWLKFSF